MEFGYEGSGSPKCGGGSTGYEGTDNGVDVEIPIPAGYYDEGSTGDSTEEMGESSPSTTDHNAGEITSGIQGGLQSYDTWYNSEKYKLLTPAEKNATLANGNPSNYFAKNNPANAVAGSITENVGSAVKGAFTSKANIAVAAVGIGLDTYDDVSQLQAKGADSATIKAAVATDVTFGVVGTSATMIASATAGAAIGTAFCPVVGTIAGVVVGVVGSYIWDQATSGIKQQARDSLAGAIR